MADRVLIDREMLVKVAETTQKLNEQAIQQMQMMIKLLQDGNELFDKLLEILK